MIFADNVLKEYLKNVYFITGTPCGGKTTVSRLLSSMYGITLYDIDSMYDTHRAASDKEHQPCMNTVFADADAFFGRNTDEYLNWLKGVTKEQLSFILLDLIRLSADSPVICDCHIDMTMADLLTDPSRAAFMIREPVNIADEYCARADHADFDSFLHSASDPDKAKTLVNRTLYTLNADHYAAVKRSRYMWIDRSEGLTPEECARRTAVHFGWIAG